MITSLLLMGCEIGTTTPLYDQTGLIIQDTIYLNKVSDFSLNSQGRAEKFYLLQNKPHYNQEITLDVSEINDKDISEIYGEINCNSEIVIKTNDLVPQYKKSKTLDFKIFGSSTLWQLRGLVRSSHAVLHIGKNINHCDLRFRFVTKDQKTILGGMSLINENVKFPFLRQLNLAKENCKYNEDIHSSDVNILFTNSYKNMTCVESVEKIETLEKSESGFQEKVKALLGQNVSQSFIDKADPLADLDFSKAPKLKAIFVASLVYRSDFYGTMISRLLKYHADRGTIVYIITTGYMQSDEDHKRLTDLVRSNGNIRLQEYAYNAVEKGFKTIEGKIAELHRNMHIKMFVTLSDDQENNVVITGGRNIHDGFLFAKKPPYEKYNIISQYAEENHVYWSDFEIKIVSQNLAKSVFTHLLTFWNRETTNQKVSFINQAKANLDVRTLIAQGQEKPIMRHIISIPFNDNMALEQLYVDMIDRSRKSIKLSSPYLRPTDKISQALERAAQRGVDVVIQTRIDLKGDTQAWLYEEMNKTSINDLRDKVKIYEWTKPSILHSKFLLVDGSFGFVGSVNVSRRSFIHDIESGFLIYNQKFIQHMEDIFNQYVQQSRLITQDQKRKPIPSTVLKLVPNLF
ncbi:MAG: phospholipase D-like domain-containing protein [Pseudobdellovibrio sp.]